MKILNALQIPIALSMRRKRERKSEKKTKQKAKKTEKGGELQRDQLIKIHFKTRVNVKIKIRKNRNV